MEHGSKQLRGWLKRSKLNQRQAAERLGLHYTTLNKLLLRSRPPGRETAIDIEAKTGIPVAAWTTRVGKPSKTRNRKANSTNVDRPATHVAIS